MQLKNATISILPQSDGTVRFELEDQTSNTTFLRFEMDAKDFVAALSRLSNCPIKEANVYELEKLNKQHECQKFEFTIPSDLGDERPTDRELEKACEFAIQCSVDKIGCGWVADKYYGSQDSFFTKNGVKCARVTIRRWV